ncbi:MAG: DUF3592 domain-containing protein [Anaerolineaceae bacterium]|nr:DUF3592 domain-containing protein [Anaerolineaceae bacterium]
MDKLFIYCMGGIFYIGGPLLLAMGLYYLFLSIWNPRQAEEIKNWPTTEGELIVIRQLGKRGWMNNIEFRYEYKVDNKEYTGRNITLFPNTIFGRERIEEIHAKYSEGQTVTVYTNPKNPKKAMLETNMENQQSYYLAWSIINIAIGTFIVSALVTGFLAQ